jgi:hypothetical protein
MLKWCASLIYLFAAISALVISADDPVRPGTDSKPQPTLRR